MNLSYLEDNLDRRWRRPPRTHVGGTGSAGTLDQEKEQLEQVKRKLPLGFAPPKKKRRLRRGK